MLDSASAVRVEAVRISTSSYASSRREVASVTSHRRLSGARAVADPARLRGQIYDYGHGLGAYFAKHFGERDLRKALVRHGISRADSIFIRRRQATNADRTSATGSAYGVYRGDGPDFRSISLLVGAPRRGA